MKRASIGFATLILGLVAVFSYAQVPVPFINQPLVPDAVAPGGPDFTLTVNGTSFVAGSIVNWNGSPLTTTFVSGSRLTATVPAADIAAAGTASVTVIKPGTGGSTANVEFLTVTAATGGSVAFSVASSIPTGAYPGPIVAADFNGDGKLDLAVSLVQGNVSIFLGDGAGNFTLASTAPAGINTSAIVVGDFNNDGKVDLAIVAGSVSILLGDGTGSFILASSPAAGYEPFSAAVGDFNADGNLDLAVVNAGNGSTVTILLGDGTGNFTVAASPATPLEPYSVVVGDFNGDGKLDLAVTSENGYDLPGIVSVLLGDGTGNFTLAASLTVDLYPMSVAAADLNGDGILDLAVANSCGKGNITGGNCNCPGTVSILLGDGTGNFRLASGVQTPENPRPIGVGDFNGDGKPDLATVNAIASPGAVSSVSILLGDGAGNFTLAASPSVNGPNWLAVGDFNGDGMLDLASGSGSDSAVVVLLQAPALVSVSFSPTSLAFGPQVVGSYNVERSFTLTNTGNAYLNITNVTATGSFSLTSGCGSVVVPGSTCQIWVTFAPRSFGNLTGAVTITDNAPDSPQTVPLTGVGTIVSLSMSHLNFGSQPVGTTGAAQVVTLTNYSARPLNILGLHFVGINAYDFAETNTCKTSLPSWKTCTVSVTFSPSATGASGAMLDIIDNGGGSPQQISVRGNGT